ncbi:hypothetical protein D7M11_21065 [Paenibacillus ginsengarvi]|uniref:Uncharacterized protein n=1 Tax=Paenibacillus ginsengarvi TaxID=400777 RepID=A0A3B0C4T6_9BACL|nr:hypothetical protein D7M11_21065 [Paenibacillus ginsengarvi]
MRMAHLSKPGAILQTYTGNDQFSGDIRSIFLNTASRAGFYNFYKAFVIQPQRIFDKKRLYPNVQQRRAA